MITKHISLGTAMIFASLANRQKLRVKIARFNGQWFVGTSSNTNERRTTESRQLGTATQVPVSYVKSEAHLQVLRDSLGLNTRLIHDVYPEGYDVWSKTTWKKVEGHHNYILTRGDLRVSYNPIAGADKSDVLGTLAQMIGGLYNGEGEPQEETALYDGKVWRILKGDFRKQYEKVFPDKEKCLAVYDKYKSEFRSEWSTDEVE